MTPWKRRVRMAAALFLATLALCAGPASGREVSCKDDPELVGPCFSLHGMLFIANGSPSARILRLGTKRILGISENSDAYMPAALEERLTWDDIVYGDFTVCPFTQSRPGVMQFVCIEAASHLVLQRYVAGKRTLSRLPDSVGP